MPADQPHRPGFGVLVLPARHRAILLSTEGCAWNPESFTLCEWFTVCVVHASGAPVRLVRDGRWVKSIAPAPVTGCWCASARTIGAKSARRACAW